MDNRALSQWMHDYSHPRQSVQANEEEWDEEEPSWFGNEEHHLDLDWYTYDRDINKHIPKLTTIVLEDSDHSSQLDNLISIIPPYLIPAIQSQLSFTALRNFLKLPLSQYFQLDGPVQLETVIGCIKQEEDVYRYLYHHHPTHPFLLRTESQLLLNVFENYELFTKGEIELFDYPIVEEGVEWDEDDEDDEFLTHQSEEEPSENSTEPKSDASNIGDSDDDDKPEEPKQKVFVINNREKFQERWNELTGGVFQFVDWTNLFAAGGSILHCLRVMSDDAWIRIMRAETKKELRDPFEGLENPRSNIEYDHDQYKSIDIDLYIYGLSAEQTRIKVQEVYEAVLRVDPRANLIVDFHLPTVTIFGPTFKPIQIILCLHKSPAEVLLHYDLNCVCVGYNGNSVMCLPKFVIGMKYKMNFLDSSMDTQDKFQIIRVYKYAKRGFSTSLPLHFRMHGYFDQEIPSNEELAKDTSHPVYFYLCEMLHIAKFKLLQDQLFTHHQGIWRWERFWQSGLTIGNKRLPGPKKNNVIKTPGREIPLPINEEQDLVAFTKHLQRAMWTEPPTRYFSVQRYMHNTDYDRKLDRDSNLFNRSNVEKLPAKLEKLELTVYNQSQYLQHFYLNCCVKTKTHTPDLSKFENPYLGLNTSIVRVGYDWEPSEPIDIKNFSNIESGRISTDPIELCGRKWQLVLESGTGMPVIFVHLKLLPDNDARDPFSSLNQAPILAANFIIQFIGKDTHSEEGVSSRNVSLDGSKIFNETSDTWSTYFHGTYISAQAANPLNIRCDPNERSNCIVDDSITIQIIVQTLTVYTPAIAF